MSPPSAKPNKFEINRKFRSILVRHWIDLGRLSTIVLTNAIHVRGTLQRLPGSPGKLTSPIVQSMFDEIGRIKGIRTVHADLDNWRRLGMGNMWEETGRTAKTAGRRSDSGDAGGRVDMETA